MRATIVSTEQIVSFRYDQGTGEYHAQGRVWVGTTESGIPVQMLVVRVAVDKDQPPEVLAQFERELQEVSAPRPELPAWPLRMIL